MMKRKTKYILLILLGITVLGIALIAFVAMTLDDKAYLKIAVKAVERFTGYRMVVEGDFTLDLSDEPYLAASKIRFEPTEGGDQPVISHIGRLELKLVATKLISGTILIKHLLVDDVAISLTMGQDRSAQPSGPRKKRTMPSWGIPVFKFMDLRNININFSDKNKDGLAKIKLRQLKIEDKGERGDRYVKGEGVINVQDFQIEGRLGTVADIYNPYQPYPVSLNLKTANVDLNVSGSIDNLIQGEGLGLHVAGEVAELSNLLKLFQVECPGLRHLKLDAGITGNVAAPSASDLNITISEESKTEIKATGSISNILKGDGTNMLISGSTTNRDLIRMSLPGILADFSKLELKGRLRDRQADYILEEIDAYGSNDQGLAVKAQGFLNFGDLTDDPPVERMDLKLRLTSPTTEAAKRFLFDWLPELGPLTAKGRIKGPIDGLSLEDLSVSANEKGPLKVKAMGRVGRIPIENEENISGLDLALSIQAEQTHLLSSALDIPLPELGSISASSQIRYSENRVQIDKVDVRTSNNKGLKVELSGSISNIPDESNKPPGDVNLRIHMAAPNMGGIEPLVVTRVLSDVGPIQGEAQITGTTQVLSIENVSIAFGQPDVLRFELRGRVGKIPLSNGQVITECDILGSVQAGDVSKLAPILGIPIPNLGPLKGTWRFIDRNGTFGLDDVELLVGIAEGFHLKVDGKIDTVIQQQGKMSVAGADLNLTASVPNVSAIPVSTDVDLSNFVPLQMKGKITGGDEGLGIRELVIHTGPEKEASSLVEGEILITESKDKLAISSTFETHTQPWVEKLMHRSVKESHQLDGKLRLTVGTDHFYIEAFDIVTKDQKPASLKANGMIKKTDGLYETDVQISTDVSDPLVIESIFGVSLPAFSPFTTSGQFKSKAQEVGFEGEAHFGKTHVKATIRRSTHNHKPHVTVKVISPAFYLADVGVYPEEPIEEMNDERKSKPTSGPLFSKEPLSFDALKALNLSLSIKADKLISKNLAINNLDFDLSLIDGLLRIEPAKLGYEGGNISIVSTLNANEPKPEIRLKANAEDVDIKNLLAYAHEPLILSGQLNLVVDLHSVGSSPHEIASSLNGEFGMAIKNGKIQREMELFTGDAIDFLTSIHKINDYQDLKCMVLKLLFENGVGKSETIFYDTPNVRTRGAGTVDLASETMEVVLQPKPKKGLPALNSAVHIYGPIVNPSVRKMPFKEAARLYGEIFMPFVFLPIRALGYLWYLMKDDKDEESPCLIMEPQIE